MLPRDLYQKLLAWKQSPFRKPLILKGARQVGKTHLLKQFANEYAHSLYINFDEFPNLSAHFSHSLSASRIIENLSIEFNHKIEPHHTLIIFDEIQECPEALNSLKYFAENAPEYHIVAAGSLLGVSLATGGFPVGKVDFITLYPLSFFEFLSAQDKPLWRKACEDNINSITASLHADLSRLFRFYMMIGGMPEAVDRYLKTQDLNAVRDVQKSILSAYELDFSKHAPSAQIMRIFDTWHAIPNQLAKANKKFMFSAIKPSARARDYEVALEWLHQAGLIYRVFNISTPKIPLDAYADKRVFKVYLLDSGLLGAMSQLPTSLVLQEHQLFQEFKGAFMENSIVQALISKPTGQLYYWTSQGTAEVDIVLQHELQAYPLEIKAGTSKHKRSLMVYDDKYHPTTLSRVTSMPFKIDGKLINYPHYLATRFPIARP